MTNDAAGEGRANPVTIEYELTREEVLSMVRWHLVHVARMRRLMLWVFIVAIWGLVLLLLGGSVNAVIGWIFIGFSLWMFAFHGLLYYFAPRLSWRNSAADGTRALEFTDDGVHVRTRNSDATNRWSMYSKTLEMPQMYLLRHGTRKGTYTYVPKRAFRSPSDELTFRALAERHIASDSKVTAP